MTYETDHDIPTLNPVRHSALSGDQSMNDYSLPDPFTDTNSIAFFSGGDRRLLLDEVVHLCQFGNNLVAVLGDQGIGTTTFLSQARYELAETAFCCFITADITMSADHLFAQIISQLELSPGPASSAGEMLATLRHAMAEGNMQRVVIIIDDAHHLGDQTLSALSSLLQGHQGHHLHVLLGGDEALVGRLDKFELVDVLVYDITLNPFTPEATLDYLNFKMSAAGYPEAERWSEEDANRIWQESEGYPKAINQVAQSYLFQHDMGETEEENKGTGLPLIHMSLLVVLLAALIMALFYLGDDNPEETTLVETRQPDIAIQPSTATPESETPTTTTAIVETVLDETRQESMKPVIESSGNNLSESEKQSVSTKPIEVDATATESASLASAPKAEQEEVSSPADKTVATEVATPVSSASAKPTEPVPTAPKKVEEPQQPLVAPASVEAINKPTSKDEAIVLSWPDEQFSLQVMAAAQRDSLERFVAQQPNRSELRMVAVIRNGQPWFVVLTGVYKDSDSARRAIQSLPQRQVNAGPWPRKIADIKRDINEYRNK